MNYFKFFLKKILKFLLPKETEIDIYRKRGVQIGTNCAFYNVSIDHCFPHLIKIGNNVTITHSSLIAHDASTKRELGYSRVGVINIGNNVFIGWGCIILGNTHIGNNVIIGAGSIINKNIPDNSVVAGNPAKVICTYDYYIQKHKELLKSSPISNIPFSEKNQKDKESQFKQLLTQDGYDL